MKGHRDSAHCFRLYLQTWPHSCSLPFPIPTQYFLISQCGAKLNKEENWLHASSSLFWICNLSATFHLLKSKSIAKVGRVVEQGQPCPASVVSLRLVTVFPNARLILALIELSGVTFHSHFSWNIFSPHKRAFVKQFLFFSDIDKINGLPQC